jgi:hypothetical protein
VPFLWYRHPIVAIAMRTVFSYFKFGYAELKVGYAELKVQRHKIQESF